ncbi:MAG: hypothetical protein JXA37_00855 [Chloroflexia bacterium]|nr:hypothetical protein [Chloroflexia bacterium]
MSEQENDLEQIWRTVQEFVRGLQRQDPTIRRWLAPNSVAELWFDLYGEAALLIQLKDYLGRKRIVLVRETAPPDQERQRGRLIEIAWVDPQGQGYGPEDLVTLHLEHQRSGWRVADLWPGALDARLSLVGVHEAVEERGEKAPLALRWLAGQVDLPLEGCGELEDVEALFLLGMYTRGYCPGELVQALGLWRDFRHQVQPGYRKAAILAAAVEQISSQIGEYGDSLQEIADFYGVAPRSVGARSREIRAWLERRPRHSA